MVLPPRLSLLVLPALLLAGCAGTPVEPPKIERISAEQLEARLPQPMAALPLEQVVALARQGVAAEEIIARIAASASRYRLSAGQILELARQGVPAAAACARRAGSFSPRYQSGQWYSSVRRIPFSRARRISR